ncbi:MAG: lytic transglycosylase domain-containing protein [Desulfarculaceae bacterium]
MKLLNTLRLFDTRLFSSQTQTPRPGSSSNSLGFSNLMRLALGGSRGSLIAQLANIIMLNSSSRLMGSGQAPTGPNLATLAPAARKQLPAPTTPTPPKALPAPKEPAPSAPSNAKLTPQDRQEFDTLIQKASRQHGVDPNLVRAVVTAESDFNPNCVSNAGAMGLMQLMPETAQDLGVSNPFDPSQNINGGTRYLAQMLERFDGDLSKALAAYNWGPSNVERGGRLPTETRNYLSKVTKLHQLYAQGFKCTA